VVFHALAALEATIIYLGMDLDLVLGDGAKRRHESMVLMIWMGEPLRIDLVLALYGRFEDRDTFHDRYDRQILEK